MGYNREYDRQLDGKGAIRAANANIRRMLNDVTAAVKADNWEMAEQLYNDIASLASSLRESAEINGNTSD